MSPFSPLSTSSGHIRTRLFRDLVLLVLFTVGLLVVANWFLMKELKREFAAARIADATELLRDEVRGLLGPVEQQLLIARDSLRAEKTTPKDRAALDGRFIPAMRHIGQIAGAALAEASGAEYLLRRESEGWLVRQRNAGDVGIAQWTRLSDSGKVQEQ